MLFTRRALIACCLTLAVSCSTEKKSGDKKKKSALEDEAQVGWSTSGEFHSADRSLIQLLSDFEKPISFYPVISSTDGEYRQDDLFYRHGINTPYSGKVVAYDNEGQINSESIFYKGMPHGPQRTYYSSKIKSSERIYDRGIMIGIHSKWWSNGKIKEEEYWSGGEYFGGKTWDNTGRLIRQIRVPKKT
jgi:hypothetical protein